MTNDVIKIGRFFTPPEWAEWCLESHGAYDAWREGASIIDPTCGQGAFLEAFVSVSLKRRQDVRAADLKRLFGVEVVPDDRDVFLGRMKEGCGIEFPDENFVTADFLKLEDAKSFDVVIGNPPWENFSDLDDD